MIGNRATEGWCAARRGVRTTPCATSSPVGLTGKPLAGTSTSLRCYKKNKVASVLSCIVCHGPVTDSGLSNTDQPFLWVLDPEKGVLYMSFSQCTQLAWNVQNCSHVFYCLVCVLASSGQWEPSPFLQNVAGDLLALDRWQEVSHLYEFIVSLCTHCERKSSGISGTTLQICLVLGRLQSCVCVGCGWQECSETLLSFPLEVVARAVL